MIRQSIPNLLTICNLLCGVGAVIIAFSNTYPLVAASILVFAGAIFDFFDGFAARLLRVQSEIGKQLDSFADLLTFGFAPAAILSAFLQHNLFGSTFPPLAIISPYEYIYILVPFLIVPFSAIRLAKFNIDTRQTTTFLGLPTPANALFFASVIFYSTIESVVLIALSIIFSLLLVSSIPMFSLKFANYSFSDNYVTYIFLGISALLLAVLFVKAIPIIIFLYVSISLFRYFFLKSSL